MSFHGSMDEIYDIVPQDMLPKDLGGALTQTKDDLNGKYLKIQNFFRQ